MVFQIMGDEDELDILRKAALSSLLKNKSGTSSRSCNSNTLFHRPTTNTNIISIIPVSEDPEEDSAQASSDQTVEEYVEEEDGDEYVVIEDSDDTNDEEVDEIIEEVIDDDEDEIVTEEVLDSAEEEEEEISNKSDEEVITEEVEQDDDDALSFASNDAFMEEVFQALETDQPDQTENSKCFRKLEKKLQKKTVDSRRRSRSRSITPKRRRSTSPSRRKSPISTKAANRPSTAKHMNARSRPSGPRRNDATSKSRRDASPRRRRLSHSRSRSPFGKDGARRREPTPPKKSRRDLSPGHLKSPRVSNGQSRKSNNEGRSSKISRLQRDEGFGSSQSPKSSPKVAMRPSSFSPPPEETRSHRNRKSEDASSRKRDKSNRKRSPSPSESKTKEEPKRDASKRFKEDKVMESRRAKFEQNNTVVLGSEPKKIKLHVEAPPEKSTAPAFKIDSTDILKVEQQGASNRGEDQEDLRTKLLQKRATASTRIFTSALKSTLVVAADVAKKTPTGSRKAESDRAEEDSKGRKNRRSAPPTRIDDSSSAFRKNKRKVSLIR